MASIFELDPLLPVEPVASAVLARGGERDCVGAIPLVGLNRSAVLAGFVDVPLDEGGASRPGVASRAPLLGDASLLFGGDVSGLRGL